MYRGAKLIADEKICFDLPNICRDRLLLCRHISK